MFTAIYKGGKVFQWMGNPVVEVVPGGSQNCLGTTPPPDRCKINLYIFSTLSLYKVVKMFGSDCDCSILWRNLDRGFNKMSNFLLLTSQHLLRF